MATNSIARPERWSVPFSNAMDLETAKQLLNVAPFKDIDETNFRGKVTPLGILQNDARLKVYEPGEIVVRQGDWGNSAFFVLAGSLRADLESSGISENSILGKQKPARRSLFQTVAQLWKNSSESEYRDVASYQPDNQLKQRGDGKQTRIFLSDISSVLDDRRTARVAAGQFFGELSALGRTPRQATVIAETSSRLLEIRWQGLRDLMRGDDKIRAHIDSIFRERALKWFLHNTPIFHHLDQTQLEQLVAAADFETYGKYDWSASFQRLAGKSNESDQNLDLEPLISRQGDHPNGVLIIRSGLARLTQQFENGHQTIGYLSPGQVYGMDEITQGWKHSGLGKLKYSLRAIGITTVVVIPTRVVEKLLLSQVPHGPTAPPSLQKQSSATAPFERLNSDFVEFLVKKRFVNGTATMLIDMDRCTRCDDCVQACASTHDDNPRFLRNGPIHHNIMVAGACMHCEDPVCMIECPTGAIHREIAEGQVTINDQTCIGCSACANNCPYDAIRMVEIRQKNGDYIRDSASHLPIVKATKCDLCVDQIGGPACQRACPQGALIRLDMHDIQSLADWIDR